MPTDEERREVARSLRGGKMSDVSGNEATKQNDEMLAAVVRK